ncbi:MAG TPA: DUF4199 domain-containing protein [Bacteroidales bacterium]|nr:DUF4199 domain-containing protein [Bacteroidales bacterium]HPT21481.1 DUF4199 domain-containing protein [Bacteroidales bacterium]
MEENKVNVWKANLTNGLIFGLIGIVYSIVIYFLDLSFNKAQGYIFILLEAVILFFLLKSYRDNYMNHYITFGQSFGAGIIICLYYSVIIAVFTYILYTVIDSGLVAKQLAFTEELMQKKGLPQASIDAGMSVQEKLMKPAIMAPLSIFGNMLWGAILSLLVSIFVRREGNPLTDGSVN